MALFPLTKNQYLVMVRHFPDLHEMEIDMLTSIETFDPQTAQRVEGVFFDIDDTFTTHGKIPACAYSALWSLKKAPLRVIPITGRPAGWCDHIARMWPVDAVVGENGAFYFWLDAKKKKLKKRFLDPDPVRREKRQRLRVLQETILTSIPGCAVASDQLYRETDLAIDFCEDVPSLTWSVVEQICKLFEKHGATCKVSSIHVNGWFGDYNKLQMTKIMARELWGIDLEEHRDRFIFCGDSPNDEPMFQFFPLSIGVRNLLSFAHRMEHLPTFLTGHNGGEGFAEMAQILLRLRTK